MWRRELMRYSSDRVESLTLICLLSRCDATAIILLLLVFGGLPNRGYHNYRYAPSGIGGIILIIVLILFLTGRL